ncbi:ABC transporter ATP-binding protein [Leptospira kanakyensis]|uniref:ABC transporter ATP-binding protein n=1 Tax=Leptospira kanakyensis TaxID=2484968 RepID=A0A6N4Q399_9LEPT|nr:ABC transporter ATP-binding protein [Leptospira kanakyensis]TGK51940.1 ABC transporter ATP-binding protein [Leptospira kanakyensis]TGK57152.1 ABC transporter ATP-binding protein [Leptospira kanakyensis]TGK71832.1 ABC transporter ATP-binding protein [Leptospira kanakyensis]
MRVLSEEYRKLWNLLSKRRKVQYFLVLILIIITAFAEVLSLGAIIPFLGVLISPEKVFEIHELQFLWEILKIKNSNEILLPITFIFAIGALIAGLFRLCLLYITTRLSFAIGADLSVEIYKRTLYQSYFDHVSRNSADVISGITSKANGVVFYVLQPILTLVSSVFLLSVILLGLFSIDPYITTLAFAIFSLLYLVIAFNAKKKLSRDGKITAQSQTILQKSLQEGLGAIRDVILDGTQRFYINLYSQADIPYRRAQGNSQFVSTSPRYTIEALGIALMAIFAYQLSLSSTNLLNVIPLLGSLAMGAQRMLPVLQQCYSAWAYLKIGKPTLIDVIKLLDQPFSVIERNAEESFSERMILRSSIELKDVSFRYGDGLPLVIDRVSLKIEKGQRIGFVGKTGSGKSTLIDIVMGLLTPTDGNLCVDGTTVDQKNVSEWQRNIAHVPQSIYLSDSTVAENIAFGISIDEIDFNRVRTAARKAQIADHIESLKLGYNTIVGERGIKLSGGQRQRIGIARALYKNATVIVFDEATSALDNETEKAVMESIDGLGKELTILMIAHRLSTVENCDKIVRMDSGRVVSA